MTQRLWLAVACVFTLGLGIAGLWMLKETRDVRVRVTNLYLVGFGKGTGIAWFDDLRVESVPEAAVTIDLPASKANQEVLAFPINWAKGEPYTKFMPSNRGSRERGGWSCGEVSHAMILRYWSMKTKLRVQGTYFYRRPQDELMIRADYNKPIPWEQMVSSLKGMNYKDPRVDPVAQFAFLFAVAARTHFPYGNEPWHRGRHFPEAMTHYFGIDPAEYERISIGAYLATHTWGDLYARINHDIDRQMPCELAICGPGAVHEVVITGYRKASDHYEYAIHFNGDNYDVNKFFRIDQAMGAWTDVPNWQISWGIKPYADPKRVPLYNKIAELPGSMDWAETPAVASTGHEYGILVPMGSLGTRGFLFHRQSNTGLPIGQVATLTSQGRAMNPTLIWAGQKYAASWSDGADSQAGIYFAQIDRNGRMLDKPALVRPNADQPALAYNGEDYGLTFCAGRDVKFMRLDHDGHPLPNSEIHLGQRRAPDVAWTGSVYAVAWADHHAILLALIGKDGRMIGGVRRMDVPHTDRCEETQIAWSGEDYGVAWVKDVGNGHRLVCFCRADKDGNILPDSQIVVSDRPAKARNTTLDFAAGQYVLTYRHCAASYDGYASFLDRDGRILETRCLFHSPEAVSHAIGDGQLNMICVRHYPDDRVLETESCILDLLASAPAAH